MAPYSKPKKPAVSTLTQLAKEVPRIKNDYIETQILPGKPSQNNIKVIIVKSKSFVNVFYVSRIP